MGEVEPPDDDGSKEKTVVLPVALKATLFPEI